MATENKPKSAASVNTNKSKKRKQRYLPQNVFFSLSCIYTVFFLILYFCASLVEFVFTHVLQKPVKKKGPYPLHPGVQGFFITCDGGKERQASHEAINVIDSVCSFSLSLSVPVFLFFSF